MCVELRNEVDIMAQSNLALKRFRAFEQFCFENRDDIDSEDHEHFNDLWEAAGRPELRSFYVPEKIKPELTIRGVEGDRLAILGRARWLAQNCGYFSEDEWETISQEAIEGDYDHMISVLKKHFEVV